MRSTVNVQWFPTLRGGEFCGNQGGDDGPRAAHGNIETKEKHLLDQ